MRAHGQNFKLRHYPAGGGRWLPPTRWSSLLLPDIGHLSVQKDHAINAIAPHLVVGRDDDLRLRLAAGLDHLVRGHALEYSLSEDCVGVVLAVLLHEFLAVGFLASLLFGRGGRDSLALPFERRLLGRLPMGDLLLLGGHSPFLDFPLRPQLRLT